MAKTTLRKEYPSISIKDSIFYVLKSGCRYLSLVLLYYFRTKNLDLFSSKVLISNRLLKIKISDVCFSLLGLKLLFDSNPLSPFNQTGPTSSDSGVNQKLRIGFKILTSLPIALLSFNLSHIHFIAVDALKILIVPVSYFNRPKIGLIYFIVVGLNPITLLNKLAFSENLISYIFSKIQKSGLELFINPIILVAKRLNETKNAYLFLVGLIDQKIKRIFPMVLHKSDLYHFLHLPVFIYTGSLNVTILNILLKLSTLGLFFIWW